MKKIVIGTPNFTSNMDTDVAVNFAKIIRLWSKKYEVHWLVVKRTFVCKARMMIVQEAYKMGADYLFWIDDDALVKEDILDRLIAHDKEIIVTPYPMRKPPYQCGVLRSRTGDIEDHTNYVNLDWNTDLNRGLIEVDGGGTHAMLTKMSVYGPPSLDGESIEEYSKRKPGEVPYPWFVLAPFGGTEDMYFCLMARRCGIKVWCDSDQEAGHVGYPEIITSGNFKAWTRKFGKQSLSDIIPTLPEGSRYIDVEAAEDLGATPTTKSTSDANAVAGNGRAPAI